MNLICIFLFYCSIYAVIWAQSSPDLNRTSTLQTRPDAPPAGFVDIRAATQSTDGPWRRARGNVRVDLPEMELRADEIDYNTETDYAEARGNVYFKHYVRNEELWAERAEYFLSEERGNFYGVRGQAKARIDARPGILTTTNPFYFEGKWAERQGEKYILHDGFITNCRVPRPWWTLRALRFDIIPNDRAVAENATFRVKRLPLFYTPYFYKALGKFPRKSGFLTPNAGNSSRRGFMFGAGYYWAINRSYDATYRTQLFTQRGFAHHVDFRGKPNDKTDFNFILYGVNDRGLDLGNGLRQKQGGYMVSATGRTELPKGFSGRAEINYLNSLLFRQAFTESFQEAVFSESSSVGFLAKHWSSYALNLAATRTENFQTIAPDDKILIRRLPEVSFQSRDRQVWNRTLPLWVSFDSAAGLLHRSQPLYKTQQFMERFDVRPRVMTALRWKDFHLIPSFAMRETYYGQSRDSAGVSTAGFNRFSREVFVELIAPSLTRTFNKKTFAGEQIKHVIEPRFTFRHVAGVQDFERILRFDETELLSNTTEAEISLINRFFVKKKGVAYEALTWQIWQRRYFDPTFGDSIIEGQRNVLLSSVQLTPYTFLDRSRNYSPIVSSLRATPYTGVGIDWRSDYDPLLGQWVNSSLTADARLGRYFLSAGHSYVRSTEVLTPKANQMRTAIGWGLPNRKGWNTAFSSVYDFRLGIMQFVTTEVAYNSDCCGISMQYRRFSFGARNENQFRVAFSIANIGSFGTLRKQEKLF